MVKVEALEGTTDQKYPAIINVTIIKSRERTSTAILQNLESIVKTWRDTFLIDLIRNKMINMLQLIIEDVNICSLNTVKETASR